MLAVFDMDRGTMKAKVPIGRGCGAVSYNPGARRVYASSGVAANVAVVQQHPTDPDRYALLEAVTTSVGASRVAVDDENDTLWTAFAEGAYDPTWPIDPDSAGVPLFPNVYYPNSIKIVSLKASNPAPRG